MILSGKDLAKAQSRITMLKGRCDLMRRRIADPREAALATVEISRVERRIDELTEQMQTYFDLFCEQTMASTSVTLVDVLARLIQRRIRLNMSQAELGKAFGQTRQSISRYEKTRYAGASLKRLIEIDLLLRAEEIRQFSTAHSMEISC